MARKESTVYPCCLLWSWKASHRFEMIRTFELFFGCSFHSPFSLEKSLEKLNRIFSAPVYNIDFPQVFRNNVQFRQWWIELFCGSSPFSIFFHNHVSYPNVRALLGLHIFCYPVKQSEKLEERSLLIYRQFFAYARTRFKICGTNTQSSLPNLLFCL